MKAKIPVDGQIPSACMEFWRWNYCNRSNAEHCFKGPGKYTVKLDAVDRENRTGILFKIII